jgi:hypothetical protein
MKSILTIVLIATLGLFAYVLNCHNNKKRKWSKTAVVAEKKMPVFQ